MLRHFRKEMAAAALLPILACIFETSLAQCPMCRTALVSSAEGQEIARAFNYGILFLLSAPFWVVGAIALLIYRARRPVNPVPRH